MINLVFGIIKANKYDIKLNGKTIGFIRISGVRKKTTKVIIKSTTGNIIVYEKTSTKDNAYAMSDAMKYCKTNNGYIYSIAK